MRPALALQPLAGPCLQSGLALRLVSLWHCPGTGFLQTDAGLCPVLAGPPRAESAWGQAPTTDPPREGLMNGGLSEKGHISAQVTATRAGGHLPPLTGAFQSRALLTTLLRLDFLSQGCVSPLRLTYFLGWVHAPSLITSFTGQSHGPCSD